MRTLEDQSTIERQGIGIWAELEEMIINVNYPQEMKVISLDIFHTKFRTEIDVKDLVEKCK